MTAIHLLKDVTMSNGNLSDDDTIITTLASLNYSDIVEAIKEDEEGNKSEIVYYLSKYIEIMHKDIPKELCYHKALELFKGELIIRDKLYKEDEQVEVNN